MNEREMFWEWAKKENPKLIDEAETGCQFAKDILDYMFMGWVGSANQGSYKLVPVDINENIESAMFSSVAKGDMPRDIYKAMIGACDDH